MTRGRSWFLAAAVLAGAASLILSEVAMSASGRFSIGNLVALPGGESDVLIASGDRIATLGGSRASWWVDGAPHSVALPGIPVRGARWSEDGAAILVGPGRIDVRGGTWRSEAAVTALERLPPPGGGGLRLEAASWSPDGQQAALLYGWEGPSRGAHAQEEVKVLDRGQVRATLSVPGATGVLLLGEQVVIAAPVVQVVTLDGAPVSKLPQGRGAPLRVKAADGGALLLDLDGSVRIMDVARGAVRARWTGRFNDVAAVPGQDAWLAVEANGRLHAGCLDKEGVRELGVVETGVRDARVAVTRDGRVVLAGAGAVPVQVAPLHLDCRP